MPFQNPTNYRQRNQAAELSCASSISEADLDLEREIVAITRYQKPYTKRILTVMARANPQNAFIIYSYIVTQKDEQNIKESTVEGPSVPSSR